ncbi:MAG: helix-turn-helix domain-containing protein [Ruminococcaceae bacterium]|nr:helix-turn-helix domain-containing protein [Oscillospiraceae bacterium]
MEILPKETHVLNGIISAQHRFLDRIHPNHGHDFFEIEYFISGEGTYVIDGTEYPIMENSLFFMSPANTHALLSDKGELINVMFSYDICDTPLLAQWFSTPNARVGTFSDEENIFIRGLLDEMVRAYKKGNTDYAVELLRCVLYKITENIMENKNRTSTHIQKAIGFIIGNFRSKITLKDTADHVKLVPSYLSSLFVEETGKNFKEYLDDVRFEYAERLLKFTDIPVWEVCSKSGFYDYANFTRRFKKRFNKTPLSLRKEVHHK